MKKILLFVITIGLLLMVCSPSGTTTENLLNDNLLPEELKGLKIYEVSDGNGNYIKIAILNREIVGSSYKSGKTTKYVLTKNLESSVNNIPIKEIISETDSIIVARKY